MKRLISSLCGGLFVMAWIIFCPAQAAIDDFIFAQPQFETIGDAESIPKGIVTALLQDASGLMWIGTQNGLIRFDGYRFRRFIHLPNDPASLSGDFVNALWATPDGRIWVGTLSDGVSVFDPASERFEHVQNDPTKPSSLTGGRISAICDDGKDGVWIATDEGLNHLPRGSKTVRRFGHDPANPATNLQNSQVRSLLYDRQGDLWVGSGNGLQRLVKGRFDGNTLSAQDQASLEGKEIRALFEAQDGKLWLGTRKHGAAWLDPGTHKLHWLALDPARPDALHHGWVSGMAQPRPDQIWLASSGGGIIIVSAADGKILQHLRHDPAVSDSLAFDLVRPLLTDHAGLLWVGTTGGGLQRINTRNKMVRVLRHSPSRLKGLSHPDVRSILELANGQILIGSSGNGIDIFDRGRGLVGAYRPSTGEAKNATDLPGGTIHALAETADGTIWAGTREVGVLRLQPGSHVWQIMSGVPDFRVRRFLVSRDGSLWVATSHGMARWRTGQSDFEVVNEDTGKPLQIVFTSLAEDAQGRIWAGSNRGLWVLEPGGLGWHGIHPQPGQPNSLISEAIESLLFDSRGRLWIATGKGLQYLLAWDGKVAQFESLNAMRGQSGKYLGVNLMEDKAGRIWSDDMVLELDNGNDSSNDKSKGKMRVVKSIRADGINVGGISSGAYAQTRDGLFLFGGPTGLAIVNPALLLPWNYSPPLVVTELKINGNAMPRGSLAALPANIDDTNTNTAIPTLLLAPEQRNFALEFAALDYIDPKKNRYQYRLQGYDKAWIMTDAEHRNAAYGNLWPGNYTLQVRGSNHMGDWSKSELSIEVQVLPAWYQTWWFLILSVLGTSSAIFGIYRWRTLRLKALIDERTADILKLGEIGQELTSTLDTEQAFARVCRQVSARLDATVFSIGIYEEAAEQIVFVYEIENGNRQPPMRQPMAGRDHPAVWCVREQRELLAASQAALCKLLGSTYPNRKMETVVYLPLMIKQQVIGCLSVQSPKRNAYGKDQLEFVRVLASYTAIALSNSIAHGDLAQAHGDLATTHRLLLETQQQMVLKEKMAGLGTLTAGVAHEINNPTNFVHVAAQNQRNDLAAFQKFLTGLIEEDEADGILPALNVHFSRLSGNVSTMLNGTERIKGIVKDLRSFTRLDEAEKKSVHLSECLLSTLNLVRTGWHDKVEFVTEFGYDPEIECWPALLNQVFMNLLINACQAIAEKQRQHPTPLLGKLTIWLRHEPEKDAIAIIFEDNGIGMNDAVAARILEPFFTTKEAGSGTGLGLSIAFGIVQKHGGSLVFVSTPGVGSQFTIYLPVKGNQLEAASIRG